MPVHLDRCLVHGTFSCLCRRATTLPSGPVCGVGPLVTRAGRHGTRGCRVASVGPVGRHLPDRSLGIAPGSVGDYRELARRRLPRQLFDYVDGGSFGETTLVANREDLGRIQLRQRVLRDVSQHTLSTTVLGQELSLPLILAPVGFGGMLARRAEVPAA